MRYSRPCRQYRLKSLHPVCRSGISLHHSGEHQFLLRNCISSRIRRKKSNFVSYYVRFESSRFRHHKFQSALPWSLTLNSQEIRESSLRNFNISFSSSTDECKLLSKNLAHYPSLSTVTSCVQIKCHPIIRLASDKNQNQTKLYFFRRPGLRYAPQLSIGTSISCPIGFRFGKECLFEYHATSMQCGVRVLYAVSDRFNFLKFFKHQEVERLLSTHEKFTRMVYFSNHNAMWQEFARVSNLSVQLTTNKI